MKACSYRNGLFLFKSAGKKLVLFGGNLEKGKIKLLILQ